MSLIQAQFELKGFDELDRQLAELGGILAEKANRQAMLRAIQPMVRAAQLNALKIAKSGSLAIAMGARYKRELSRATLFGKQVVEAAVVSVGPIRRDSAARAAYTVYYHRSRLVTGIRHGHLVEYGTKHSPAMPFLRPAFDSRAAAVVRGYGLELRTAIDRVARRQKAA